MKSYLWFLKFVIDKGVFFSNVLSLLWIFLGDFVHFLKNQTKTNFSVHCWSHEFFKTNFVETWKVYFWWAYESSMYLKELRILALIFIHEAMIKLVFLAIFQHQISHRPVWISTFKWKVLLETYSCIIISCFIKVFQI